MKEKILYFIWLSMYVLCAGLAFISEPQGATKLALAVIAVLFFVPGAVILYEAMKRQDKKAILCVRIISGASLALTAVTLAATFISIRASAAVGKVLYEILILVSSPMICGQYWVISLFLWSCLFVASFSLKKGSK